MKFIPNEKPDKSVAKLSDCEQMDVLQVQDVNCKGYGGIAKLVMQDKRLSIQAKGIYAYFCSYAGLTKVAFPRMTKVIDDLCISRDCYYKHFNMLKEYGYIKVEQERQNGRFWRNLYTIMQSISAPTCAQPLPLKQDTVKTESVKPQASTQYNKQSLKSNNFNINSVSERTPAPAQNRHGEFMQVCLTAEQFDMLVRKHGRDVTLDYIDRIDRHMASEGKSYANHCATIEKWIAQDKTNSATVQPTKPEPSKPNRFCNFEQRNIDFEELERKEREYLQKSLAVK